MLTINILYFIFHNIMVSSIKLRLGHYGTGYIGTRPTAPRLVPVHPEYYNLRDGNLQGLKMLIAILVLLLCIIIL